MGLVHGAAVAVACLIAYGCAAAPAVNGAPDIALIKARVLSLDPVERQPPVIPVRKNDDGSETICLRCPASVTLAVDEGLIGETLPRHIHAIMAVDAMPDSTAELILLGSRSEDGRFVAASWYFWRSGMCQTDEAVRHFHLEGRVAALNRSKRLLCRPS